MTLKDKQEYNLGFSSFILEGDGTILNETRKGSTKTTVSTETCQDKAQESQSKTVDMETVSCDDDDVEQKLIQRLRLGQNKHVRPVKNREDTVNVGFDFSYNQLVDLVKNCITS